MKNTVALTLLLFLHLVQASELSPINFFMFTQMNEFLTCKSQSYLETYGVENETKRNKQK